MKRLILCCDSAWDPPRGGHTNVLGLARAIASEDEDGVTQVVYYQDRALSVETEEPQPLGRDIRGAYRFLVHNYADGDEIWLFGSSRGATIARCCIGLLRNVWLLDRRQAHRIDEAYRIYRTRWRADAANAVAFRQAHCRQVSVRFLGVWDTVGDGGVPGKAEGENVDAGFHDNRLSGIVEHGYHALAIDERRKTRAPVLWRTHPERTRTEQCWFAGNHQDIGGGHAEDGLSRITLAWMADKAAAAGLAFDRDFLDTLTRETREKVVHGSGREQLRRAGFTRRIIGCLNGDEILHTSAEQRFLRDNRYRPGNLAEFLARDEQIQLPL
jgi:uncharacterized protein (DUF2235 family)